MRRTCAKIRGLEVNGHRVATLKPEETRMHPSSKLAGPIFAALIFVGPVAGCAWADSPVAPPADTVAVPAAEPSSALPADAEIFVYPSKGQDARRVDRDRYECHNWAVAQSHYDPSEPHLAPHQRIEVVSMPPPGHATVAGAVTGAVIGAAIGSPRDTGEGAVAGAGVGAIAGASSEAARRKDDEQVNKRASAESQAERARLERQATDYRRAISACLEGRGYTVE
jgi:hypothetical protein